MIPSWLVRITVALAVFVLMDLWAMLLHGRVWHTLLWPIHRSHHRRRRGLFERNDALSALHVPIAMAAIVHGCQAAPELATDLIFAAGVGMSLFGVAYFVVHDGLVHGRLPVQGLARIPYLARVRAAHAVHHGKARGGPPYGLFFGPWELGRARRRDPALVEESSAHGDAASPRKSPAPHFPTARGPNDVMTSQ
jgi:beta-carotene 3-hydroxylase